MVKNGKNKDEKNYDDVDAISDFVRLSTVISSEQSIELNKNEENNFESSEDTKKPDTVNNPTNLKDQKNKNNKINENSTDDNKNTIFSNISDSEITLKITQNSQNSSLFNRKNSKIIKKSLQDNERDFDVKNENLYSNGQNSSYDMLIPVGIINDENDVPEDVKNMSIETTIPKPSSVSEFSKVNENNNDKKLDDKSIKLSPIILKNNYKPEATQNEGIKNIKSIDTIENIENINNYENRKNISDNSKVSFKIIKNESESNKKITSSTSINNDSKSSIINIMSSDKTGKNYKSIENLNKIIKVSGKFKNRPVFPKDNSLYDKHVINFNYDNSILTEKKRNVRDLGTIKVLGPKSNKNFAFRQFSKSNKTVDVLYVDKNKEMDEKSKEKTFIECLDKIKENTENEKDPSHKFFLGTTLSTIHIKDTFEIADYKNRNLYDSIQKRQSILYNKNKFNFIKILENKIYLYKSESIHKTKIATYENLENFFPSPENNNYFYPLERIINLNNFNLFINLTTNIGEKIVYFFTCCIKPKLLKIQNMEIIKIMDDFNQFLLEYKQGTEVLEVGISSLSFSLISSSESFNFYCDNPVNFMKWLTVIQMRKDNLS